MLGWFCHWVTIFKLWIDYQGFTYLNSVPRFNCYLCVFSSPLWMMLQTTGGSRWNGWRSKTLSCPSSCRERWLLKPRPPGRPEPRWGRSVQTSRSSQTSVDISITRFSWLLWSIWTFSRPLILRPMLRLSFYSHINPQKEVHFFNSFVIVVANMII